MNYQQYVVREKLKELARKARSTKDWEKLVTNKQRLNDLRENFPQHFAMLSDSTLAAYISFQYKSDYGCLLVEKHEHTCYTLNGKSCCKATWKQGSTFTPRYERHPNEKTWAAWLHDTETRHNSIQEEKLNSKYN